MKPTVFRTVTNTPAKATPISCHLTDTYIHVKALSQKHCENRTQAKHTKMQRKRTKQTEMPKRTSLLAAEKLRLLSLAVMQYLSDAVCSRESCNPSQKSLLDRCLNAGTFYLSTSVRFFLKKKRLRYACRKGKRKSRKEIVPWLSNLQSTSAATLSSAQVCSNVVKYHALYSKA